MILGGEMLALQLPQELPVVFKAAVKELVCRDFAYVAVQIA